MHYHAEVIVPPTDDHEALVGRLLAPFDEQNEGDDASSCQWWDWWVIGGRYAEPQGKPGDVCTVGEITEELTAYRTLIGYWWGEGYESGPWFGAHSMTVREVWDGVGMSKVADYEVSTRAFIERVRSRPAQVYPSPLYVADDWLCVTVDYHS